MDDATTKSLQANESVVTESEVKQMRKRIRELERMLGRQTMRTEILEEAVIDDHAMFPSACSILR